MSDPEATTDAIRIVALLGPTAAGKSALALALAERLDGEIVACDSQQVYLGMDIGTAKPTREERRRIPHHGLDLCHPDQPFHAARWAALARAACKSIARGAAGCRSSSVGRACLPRAHRRPLRGPPARSGPSADGNVVQPERGVFAVEIEYQGRIGGGGGDDELQVGPAEGGQVGLGIESGTVPRGRRNCLGWSRPCSATLVSQNDTTYRCPAVVATDGESESTLVRSPRYAP